MPLPRTLTPPRSLAAAEAFVPETWFGRWFLGTNTWFQSVLKVALLDLSRLIDGRARSYPVVVDAGCGQGASFRLLKILFRAKRLVGVDFDEGSLAIAKRRVAQERLDVDFLQSDCSAIDLPDASADLVLCHQAFHHLVRQEAALREWRRILKPGGLLLFSESTRAYIHSWVIRWLFAHPMDVQKTAGEYEDMLKRQGFVFEPQNVSYPYPWWSRPDFGLREALGLARGKRDKARETLVNIVARRGA
jgi:SAM-dependent methyltransferase